MIKECLFKILTASLIVVLSVLLIIEVTTKKTVIDYLESSNLSLYDNELNELDCIEFDNLNPFEELTYYLKLENYNIEDLEYRVIFHVVSVNLLIDYLDITCNDESLSFYNYKGSSEWLCTNENEVFLKINIKINDSINELQNLLLEFDLCVESRYI